jgi:tetratricopeptide (TPR) repeat protein
MQQYTQNQIKFIQENFKQGEKALNQGMFERAEKLFLAILKIAPELMDARQALAFAYSAGKKHELASKQFLYILDLHPHDIQSRFNLANSLNQQNLFSEAIVHYQAILRINPNIVDAYINCAFSYKMLNAFDSAIEYLSKALKIDENNINTLQALGMTYLDLEDYKSALRYLENCLTLAPKNPNIRISFAVALERAGLDYEATAAYRETCEMDPNNPTALTAYANHLLLCHQFDEAIEALLKAKELTKNSPLVCDLLGDVYSNMGDLDKALEQYDNALKIEPNRISSLIGKGSLFRELGETQNAIIVSDQIINAHPDSPSGFSLKAQVTRSQPSDGLIENLNRLLEKNKKESDEEITIHFSLGKVYDDQKLYSKAFEHYLTANSLKSAKHSYIQEEEDKKVDAIIKTFDRKFFEDHQGIGVDSGLPIFIVGMPRSGTTLIEQIISSHPSVQGAGEVLFWWQTSRTLPLRFKLKKSFPECANELNKKDVIKVTELYEETLRRIVGPASLITHITDKMPHNFVQLGLIALMYPNAKIIHTKRNPMDTCLSIFFQSFNDFHPYSFNLENLGHHYKNYQRLMTHWHDVLPGRVFDVNYEDVTADPERLSRGLIAHCGLDWDDACLSPHKLERAVKTASHWQVRQPIYKTSVERWRRYEEFLGPLVKVLA